MRLDSGRGGETGLKVWCCGEEHVPGPEHGDTEEEKYSVFEPGEGRWERSRLNRGRVILVDGSIGNRRAGEPFEAVHVD